MKIQELLEGELMPFPSHRVKPTSNPPRYGAELKSIAPYQDEIRMNQQRAQLQMQLDPFTRSYIRTALWSSTDEDGEPLDSRYDIDDISNETLMTMVKDCQDFQRQNSQLLANIDDGQAGHDFWLTRCGHGAGFWDRGLGDVGEALTKAACAYRNVDLYVGDDGKIYE